MINFLKIRKFVGYTEGLFFMSSAKHCIDLNVVLPFVEASRSLLLILSFLFLVLLILTSKSRPLPGKDKVKSSKW